MDLCMGLNDWFYCLRCPYLCTKSCPIENEDAFKQLSAKIRDIDRLKSESGEDMKKL